MRPFLTVCCLLAMTAATLNTVSARPQLGDWLSSGYDFAKETVGSGYDFAKGTAQGTGDMYRAYSDMRDANWKDSDRYFHARGNSDAAKRGAGGRFAAETISNGREWFDRNIKGDSDASSARDQEANQHGRGGGDPNKFRPKGLPEEY